MSWKSRLPEIEVELPVLLDAVAKAVAEQIAEGAKERVPVDTGKLRDAIHVDHDGPGSYNVVAGDSSAFYGHIVEHGGVRQGARPFMVPAAEQTKPLVPAIGKAVLGKL